MKFSAHDYDEETQKLVLAERERQESSKLKVEKRCAEMTVEDHLQLLEIVFRGHVGAKDIRVHYNPMYYKASDILLEVHGKLRGALGRQGWYAAPMEHFKGTIISNFDYPDRFNPDYSEYPYRKFKIKSTQETEVKFWIPDYAIPEQVETLMLFKDFIHVELWGLLIHEDRICVSE